MHPRFLLDSMIALAIRRLLRIWRGSTLPFDDAAEYYRALAKTHAESGYSQVGFGDIAPLQNSPPRLGG